MLRLGKISENVLKRSVLKRIHNKSKCVLQNAAVGVDAAAIALFEDKGVVTCIETVCIDSELSARLCVYKAVNNIAASFGKPVSIETSIILPEGYEEQDLRTIMTQIDDVCGSLDIALVGGHTEVSPNVKSPIITVSALGRIVEEPIKQIRMHKAQPGDAIIATKWIAISGTSIVASNKKEALLTRFSPEFVDRAINCDKALSVVGEAIVASANGATSMHDASSGGIFAALWELGSSSNVGLNVDIKKLPIFQETVEICEECKLNPYELMSDGCLLITTPNGEDMVRLLNEANINATIIGHITDNNDRTIINGDEIRYIDLPKADELYKMHC